MMAGRYGVEEKLLTAQQKVEEEAGESRAERGDNAFSRENAA